jgi:polysaccharide chain length determinant protein (PEP-CTERM system associated)
MLPGRVYTFDDIAVMVRRRLWIIILPVVIFGAGTFALLDKLPDKYRADTLILVIPQRVPESFVKSTVTGRLQDRLQSISQQLLSRTRLERIIRDFNLYPAERQRAAMEDVVERMRTKDIRVGMEKGDTFRVSYIATNPVMAQKVTQQLASLFIEENLRDREMLADATNAFIDTQLEDARRRLVEQEKQLEEYRVRHAGQLPSQLQSNLQVSQNLQTQLQGLIDSVNRDRDRRLVLERMMLEVESAPSAPSPAANESSPAAQLEALHQSLTAMEGRLKSSHPDVIQTKNLIRDLEAKIAANPEAASGPRETTVTGELARRRRLEALRAEIQTLDLQLADKEERRREFSAQIIGYDARIAAVPARESELASLTRDYETLQKMYTDLLSKREQSKVAANLERRQIGEQFNVLDPARVPERPFSPNRPLLLLAGLAVGLLVGTGLAGWREYRDTSLRSDADIRAALGLPLLGEVPVIQTVVERRRRRTKVLALSFATGTLVVAAVFLAWRFSMIAT